MAVTATAAHTFKVVVAGTFAVGKSTLIRQISETEVVGTEAATSGSEAAVKDTTTVGMEYGTFTVGDGASAVELLLHGLPGQDRFRFMWDIVSTGADAFLLLVDATRPETWAETSDMADHLLRREPPAPVLVGVNRAGDAATAETTVAAVATALGLAPVPHVACDVLDPASARAALVELLLLVLDGLDEPPPRAAPAPADPPPAA